MDVSGIIRDLPPGVFIVMVGFFLAMAGVVIVAGLHAKRRAALVEATETSTIGSATDGYREFEGTIEAVDGHTLKAALTFTPCVWYHAKVERFGQRPGSGKRTTLWSTVHEMTSSAPFLLRDASGVCVVDPVRAEVTPTDKSMWYGDAEYPDDRNPPKVGPTESTTPIVEVGGGSHKYRYSEERLYDAIRCSSLETSRRRDSTLAITTNRSQTRSKRSPGMIP